MALRASIYRVVLTVSDLDRSVYSTHSLTIARHPSETEERLMVRVLAFALHASESLVFGRGLSTEEEPDLCRRDATGAIDLWIDVGLPDERAIRKACGRARQVSVLAYGERRTEAWWASNAGLLSRLANLSVSTLSDAEIVRLAAMAARSMDMTCTIQDGHVWLASDNATVEFTPLVRISAIGS
jgi:uncharacterized protein YaeQ